VTKFWKAGLTVVALLGGCEYFDATRGVEPPPAQGRPFPNLASVPRAPEVGPSAERQSEVERLTATRDFAIRQDQQIRAVDPGGALPAPRLRAVPAAPAARTPASPEAPAAPPAAEPAAPSEPPATERRSTAATPRPQLSSSLFMGTVVVPGERGLLAEFQRKVLQDSAAMAQRTNGRIRLVGGRSPQERQQVVSELAELGIAAGRISAAADPADANRAGIDVVVEN
jgi:hypothetical protein